jgi:hypothetical protein
MSSPLYDANRPGRQRKQLRLNTLVSMRSTKQGWQNGLSMQHTRSLTEGRSGHSYAPDRQGILCLRHAAGATLLIPNTTVDPCTRRTLQLQPF